MQKAHLALQSRNADSDNFSLGYIPEIGADLEVGRHFLSLSDCSYILRF